jgi:hypothetical protein
METRTPALELAKSVHALNRAATVIGFGIEYFIPKSTTRLYIFDLSSSFRRYNVRKAVRLIVLLKPGYRVFDKFTVFFHVLKRLTIFFFLYVSMCPKRTVC